MRATVWEWALVALLAGNLAWTTLCLGGFRPETMMVTGALNAALVCVHLLSRVVGRSEEREGEGNAGRGTGRAAGTAGTCFHPAGWWLVPFLVYAAANARWITPVPWLGWLDWLGWAQMIAVFWVVLNGVRSRAARATLFGALVAIGFAAVLLAAYQKFVKPEWLMMGRTQAAQFVGRASGPFGIPNSLAALLLLLLPPTLALTVRRGAGAVQRVLGGYLVLAFAFGLFLTVSRGAWLALLLALALWPLAAGRGSRVRRVGLAAAAGAAMLAMVVALYFLVPRVRERLVALKTDSGEVTRPIMWRGAWRIFGEHPVGGGGAGSYNVLFDAHRPERYQDEPRWAHNDYLNTLSDYGAVGFILFFGAAGVIAWRCGRRAKGNGRIADDADDDVKPARNRLQAGSCLARGGERGAWIDDPGFVTAMAVGLGAFGLQLFVDFHFKIPALAMAFAVIAALVAQRRWPDAAAPGAPRSRLKTPVIGLVVFAVAGATIAWVQPFYRAEALRYAARQSIDRLAVAGFSRARWGKVLGEARAVLTRAVELSPANGAAWADLAYATVLNAHVEPERTEELARAAERAADQALARSKVVPVFWVRRGVALDLQGRGQEAGAAFDEAVRLAPARANIWFNYAFHLSLDRKAPQRAQEAVDFCLRLDPGNREAQALRQRLADRSRAP